MITGIRLQRFRSYDDVSFDLEPGVNIIVGPNASGKTNLLEAILVVSLGSSYRGADAELPNHGSEWARIDVHTETGRRTLKLEVATDSRVQKSFQISDKPYKRLAHDKTLPLVLFEPDHLRLMTGRPELRRDYMDDLLEQLVGGYATLRRQYKRTLAQRNALLKRGPNTTEQLFAWNVRLSELGGKMAEARKNLIEKLNTELSGLYYELSGDDAGIKVEYVTTCNQKQYGSDLLHKLESSTELDYQRGFTAYGPHRDDFVITINGHDCNDVASRGEMRTLLLGLKIMELRLLEEARGKKPIILLDDVFSELDGARRRALTNFLSGYQTFITTTDADVVVQHFMDACNIIPLTQGDQA